MLKMITSRVTSWAAASSWKFQKWAPTSQARKEKFDRNAAELNVLETNEKDQKKTKERGVVYMWKMVYVDFYISYL